MERDEDPTKSSEDIPGVAKTNLVDPKGHDVHPITEGHKLTKDVTESDSYAGIRAGRTSVKDDKPHHGSHDNETIGG